MCDGISKGIFEEISPYELSIRQRVERATYQSLDINGIIDKYVKGRRVLLK
jgi:hypothetical protein